MKLLYVLRSLQHPTLRGALRHYHLLRELARNHAITLLALGPPDLSGDAEAEIRGLVSRLHLVRLGSSSRAPQRHAPVLLRRAIKMVQFHTAIRQMRAEFEKLVQTQRFDALLFHGKQVTPVIAGYRGLPTVVDVCDATSLRERERLRRASLLGLPARLWRYGWARRVERELLSRAPHLAFISPRDREALLGEGSGAAIVPNGIELGYWRRAAAGGEASSVQRIVFTGVMDYAPNHDAGWFLIREIVPRLRRTHPAVEVQIVGRDPAPALVQAGREAGVAVTGFVPDVRPYLENASVFVAPIRFASGLQNKVLEAFAMELPVVATPVVAAGVRVEEGEEPPVRKAESAEQFAAALAGLLEDESGRKRLGRAGGRYVAKHFDWGRSARRLEALCLEAVASGRG